MKKLLTLLLAIALLLTGTTAFAKKDKPSKDDSKDLITDTNVSFFLQLDGLQMDTSGNVSSRPTELFTDVIKSTQLIAKDRTSDYTVVIGDGVTSADILAEVTEPPADNESFDEVRDQLMYKGYIRSDSGEVVPWAKLNTDNYGIEWYVLKHETECWHIDGRIIDLATEDIIDIVIPDDPADIPPEAYEEDKDDDGEKTDADTDTEEEKTDTDTDAEAEKDTSISLKGAKYAYIFGYEPVITSTVDENGNKVHTAEIYMGMEDSVTVEQVSSMLMRLLDQQNRTRGKKYPVVSSIKAYEGEWFERGLAYQCATGGLDSEGDVKLGNIKRGLVAKLVSHALELNLTAETPFTDIAGSEYEEDIKKVYAYGYMNGVSDTSFAPEDIMTRAEFCAMFNNIIGRDKMGLTALDENGNEYQITAEDYSFVDMDPSHWAYEICLKATSAYDDDGYVSVSKRQQNVRNIVDDYDSQKIY